MILKYFLKITDFTIAGLLSPPGQQDQQPPQLQPQIQPPRRPSDDDVVFVASTGPNPSSRPQPAPQAVMQPQQQPQLVQNFLTPQPQMTSTGGGRPIYLQHMPNTQLAQGFAQSFQQQTGRTLQYIGIPTMQFGAAPLQTTFGLPQYAMAQAAQAAATAATMVPAQAHFQPQNLNYIQAGPAPQSFIINQPTVS